MMANNGGIKMEIELGKCTRKDCEDKVNEYYFIKKLILHSITYPGLKIEQLDLCLDGDEEFTVWLNVSVSVKKEELMNLLRVANDATSFALSDDEQLPAKITIETFPKLEKEL